VNSATLAVTTLISLAVTILISLAVTTLILSEHWQCGQENPNDEQSSLHLNLHFFGAILRAFM
jgi:hypothetical protein